MNASIIIEAFFLCNHIIIVSCFFTSAKGTADKGVAIHRAHDIRNRIRVLKIRNFVKLTLVEC
jgi:hypothetical protein